MKQNNILISWGLTRMEAPVEGGQGLERNILPYMDGWNNALIVLDHKKAQEVCFYYSQLQMPWQIQVCDILVVEIG
jgi:hypothetical protein